MARLLGFEPQDLGTTRGEGLAASMIFTVTRPTAPNEIRGLSPTSKELGNLLERIVPILRKTMT